MNNRGIIFKGINNNLFKIKMIINLKESMFLIIIKTNMKNKIKIFKIFRNIKIS